MSTRNIANTHKMFHTVGHEHLDTFVLQSTGRYPDSGLNLVECADGRWYVEVDFGAEFDNMEGISRPHSQPYTNPRFFDSRLEALDFAVSCIQQVCPDLKNRDEAIW